MTPEQRAADWFTLPPSARTKAWLAREFRKAIEEATNRIAICAQKHSHSQILTDIILEEIDKIAIDT